MMSLTISDQHLFLAFWLAFARWSAVLFQLPLFDNLSVPNIIKVLSSFVMTWAFFDITKAPILLDIKVFGVDHIWYLTTIHAASGLLIGFLVKSIMALFVASGTLITQQVGFASVSYFDSTQATQVGPFEKIIQWTMIILILTSGALVPMFKGIIGTFSTINALHLEKFTLSSEFFTIMFKEIFTSAVLLASPLIFANILMNLVFGIISRAVPQLNVLMVSFVVNIGFGLIIFMAISTEFFDVAFNMYTTQLAHWFQFIQ